MESVCSRQFDAYLGNLYRIDGVFIVMNHTDGAYPIS